MVAEDDREFATSVLHITLALEVIRVAVVIVIEGRDSNHIPFSTVPKDNDWLLVGPAYHSLQYVTQRHRKHHDMFCTETQLTKAA